MRRLFVGLLVVVGLLLLAGVLLVTIAPRIELGPVASRRLSAMLSRAVDVGSLRVATGQTLHVTLRDARLDNVAGGSAPDMARVARVDAEVDLMPLLRGEIVIRSLNIEGFSLLLERTADDRANWKCGADAAASDGEDAPADDGPRASVPTILALRIADSALTFRTSSGNMLRTHMARGDITTEDATQPIALSAEGSYNDVPLTLRGTLGSFEALRDVPSPFPMTFEIASGDTTLSFRGHSRAPLDFDRLEGALALRAPTVAVLLAIAGAERAPPVGLSLSGDATREGDAWRLAGISGELDGEAFTGEALGLTEGSDGRPDAVAASLAFTRLNFDRLLGGGEQDDGPDMSLRVALEPDPLVTVDVSAEAFTYGRLNARDARLKGEVAPSRITLEELSLFGFGAHLSGRVDVTPAGEGARLAATADLRDSEIDALRRSIGLGTLPITGRVNGRLVMEAEGTALNEALRGADGTAVLGISSGRIAREVVELASTDIRALFRTAEGTTQVTCMLAVAKVRDGKGEVAPLHLRAGTGAISGIATFDLNRQWLDMVIGSRRETTHTLALDIPVRISGAFSDLSFEPASGGLEERAQGAGARNVQALPDALRDAARGNACYRSAMGQR